MRVAIVGFGAMGQRAARLLLSRGHVVALVVDPAPDLPQRIAQVFAGAACQPLACAQLPELAGLQLELALHTFASHLSEIEACSLAFAEAGINVASIAEDAFDPFFADADLAIAERLDAAFKRSGACLIATGVQDNFLYQTPLALLSACEDVRHVRISNIADLSKLGPAVLEHLPIGANPADCQALCAELPPRLCFDVAIRPLLRRLGRSVVQVHNQIRLLVAAQAFSCSALDLHIEAGQVYGLEEHSVLHLDDGSQFELSLQPAVLADGQGAYYRCAVDCASPLQLTIEPFDGAMLTCAALVSRALALGHAPSGFISVEQLG